MFGVLTALGGFATVLIGRATTGRWFNHLSLYACLWSCSLILLDLHFLQYYRIHFETWVLIAAGWAAFTLGSIIAFYIAKGKSDHNRIDEPVPPPDIEGELRILNRLVWILSIIALCAAIQHWLVLIGMFGSLPKVILMANLVYSLRIQNEIPGMIPYLDSLALTAGFFAGMIAAGTGRLKLVCIVPLIVMVVAEMAMMGRARLVVAAVLFASGYSLYGFRTTPSLTIKRPVFRRVVTILVTLAFFIGGAGVIKSTRGGTESFQGATRALNAFKEGALITPSIYLYLTAHHVVFDQYLRDNREKPRFGENSLSPVYNILTKMGFDVSIPRYQTFYRTPHTINTGTYLKELHADFGLAGVLIIPFVIGFVCLVLLARIKEKFSFVQATWIGYLYSIVGMSVFVIGTRLGSLLAYLLSGLVVSWFLDRSLRRRIK